MDSKPATTALGMGAKIFLRLAGLLGAMSSPRYKRDGLVLLACLALIAGGAAQAEIYDPRTQVFSVVPGQPRMAGRFAAVAPLADGRVLVTGGYGDDIAPQAGAWLYLP
ncbi:hypothetical protein [Lysobacter sp. F6437]|uniref:hypothetical protein n=1 Tax=Lysobacter sp. F6437 TaxID=3459296 RepID=UPI00403D90F1